MDRGESRDRVRVAIFGGGRVGTAMAAEMPSVPVVGRGGDAACDYACVCWPAHALAGFAAAHPRAASARRVAWCNGAWARDEGADDAGICYVRALRRGDRAAPGRKGWRVGSAATAAALRRAGLGVVLTRGGHEAQVWGKTLYLLPLAFACEARGEAARCVIDKEDYAVWYDVVRTAAVEAIGEAAVAAQEPRVRHLCLRTPRGWYPSPSAEELAYFRRRLGCAE